MKILLDSIAFDRIDTSTISDLLPNFETLGIRVDYTVYFSHTNKLTGCTTLEWTGVIDENKIVQIINEDLKKQDKMKIEKGRTLSQFVDFIAKSNEFTLEDEPDGGMSECADKYCVIYDYNNRLKEPLTKGMFVNPYEKPKKEAYFVDGEFKEKYCFEDLETWEEAENMVIFKDDRVYLDESYPDCVCIKNGGVIPLGWSLAKLFDATNGELELKNFEI